MKQIRFSDLPTSSQVNEADVFPIIQDGDNKKAQQSSIKDYSQYKNIPKVNGRALNGNVTLDELGAQAPGNYLTEKELLDADLVTKVENANKADKNYGAENSGKYLGTDENGEIAPIDVKFSDDNKIIKIAQGNPTIISDSADWRLKKLNIYGQSSQDSTTGAQLLNMYSNGVNNGVTWSCEGSVVIFSGTILEDSVYRINAVIHNKDTYKAGKTYYAKSFTNDVFVDIVVTKQDNSTAYLSEYTVDGTEKELYCRCIINNTMNKPGVSINKVAYIAITENDAMSEWEPYTGGKPSPSPDYPQEIISKEVSEIKITNGADLSQTITLAEPITLRGIPVDNGGNITIDGQQYVSDVICEKDGIIGTLRNIIRPTLRENLTFTQTPDVPNRTANFLALAESNLKNGDYESLSSHFVWSAYGINRVNRIDWTFAITGRGLYISAPAKEVDYTKEEIESLVNGEWAKIKNDVKFYAQLSEPTFEPLPEEVQAQYKALKSYYPNTVIQTGCWNEVEYEVSLQSFIEDMYKKIKEVNNNNNKLSL